MLEEGKSKPESIIIEAAPPNQQNLISGTEKSVVQATNHEYRTPHMETYVPIKKPSLELLIVGIFGYVLSIGIPFYFIDDMEWDVCFNILCCGSFFSTLCIIIHGMSHASWEKKMGQSSISTSIIIVVLVLLLCGLGFGYFVLLSNF